MRVDGLGPVTQRSRLVHLEREGDAEKSRKRFWVFHSVDSITITAVLLKHSLLCDKLSQKQPDRSFFCFGITGIGLN